MKIFVLFLLFVLVSCSGGDGANKNISSKVVTPPEADEVENYFQQSLQTLPVELKLNSEDISNLKSELTLTAEEQSSLDQLH